MRTSVAESVYFCVGNAKLTRRVKKLSRERGLPVTEEKKWNRYGCEVLGYYCDPDVYAEVTEQIGREEEREAGRQEAKAAREAALRAEAERQQRLALEAELDTWFPHLPEAIRTARIEGRVSLYGQRDELPSDQYSPKQWELLGCRVKPDQLPTAYVVRWRGKCQTALFAPHATELIPSKRAGWDDEKLWTFWRRGFTTDLLATATAVRFANRLIKLAPFAADKKALYSVKDRFICAASAHLREGRVSRVESRMCWGCNGTGGRGEYDCMRCDGSGVYSSRTLHEHLFVIDGEEFCFHSYIAPPKDKLLDAPGADLPSYGRRFTAAELRRVRLRVSEFVGLIGHALTKTPSPFATAAQGC